ncbi:MAG: ATP-binding protein [Bdellovibrionales bacterium]
MFSLRRKKDETTPLPFADFAKEEDARIVIDQNGVIVFATAAFMDLAHLTSETIANHKFNTLLSFTNAVQTPEDIEPGMHNVTVNGNQNSQDFHFDWIHLEDSRRYLIASYTNEANENTPPSQNSTKNTYEDIDVFLNLSREMMVVVDHQDKILKANARFAEKIGYSADELDDISFDTLFDEDDKNKLSSSVPTPNNAYDFEARIITKEQASIWVEWRKQNFKGLTYYAGRDVTAIKAQQTALKHGQKQLSQAEAIGRMGHWRWVLGEDSIEWSQEIYRIFGVDQNAFTTTLDNMNAMIHEDDVDRLNQALHRAVIEENDYDVEFTILRPDGEERFIRSEGRCSTNDDGEVIALFGIMQDMTERMLYEHELKTAKDSAERAYAAKTQFLANMSHELRTPLNAIIGFSEMMERQLLGPLGNEKYVDYIGGIRESGEHLLDLISDILDMSKIEAGKYDLMLEELNVAKVIQVSLHMIENRALDADVKLSHNLTPETDLKIVADRRCILQVMLNLLSNAVKFSKENGEINIDCKNGENEIILEIIDNGIGIPANKLATITNPFEQVSSSYARDHEGSGLGLAITKELIELHNGELTIKSTIDVGTTVQIKLPYHQPSEPESPQTKH